MCDAPSTWRARMCVMLPRAFNAEYSGLIAAPGTPNAWVTPSRSSTRTAASIALILDIVLLLLRFSIDRSSCFLDSLRGRGHQRRKVFGVLVQVDFHAAVENIAR